MKIAFLNLYSGINSRGAETFAHGLAERLAQNQDVTLFAGRNIHIPRVKVEEIPTTTPLQHQGFGFGLIADLRKRFFLDQESLTTLFFSLKVFPKLWHGHYNVLIPVNGFWQVIACQLVKIFRGGKIVITGHSGPGWMERWNLYLLPDCFVATTEPTAKWAKKAFPWTRIEVIPYGIDIDKFKNAKPAQLNLERPIILCPAAADYYKRVNLAIKVVAEMKKGSLLHLGTGPIVEGIKDLGETLLGEKRFLSMAVDQKAMPEYYAACDLVTLPSTVQENSPMVFLETMAAGKFTITTDAPRSRWILGKAGIFVDPEDTDEYTKAIQTGLLKKDKKIISDQVSKFSWNKIVAQYNELLKNIS